MNVPHLIIKNYGVYLKMKCEKLGVLYKMEDIILAYKNNYGNNQLSWF